MCMIRIDEDDIGAVTAQGGKEMRPALKSHYTLAVQLGYCRVLLVKLAGKRWLDSPRKKMMKRKKIRTKKRVADQ